MSVNPESSQLFDGQVMIHNILRRTFDAVDKHLSVYIQTESERAKLPHLFTYTAGVIGVLHSHHSTEDDIYFPLVSERLGVDTSNFSQDHVKFVADLESVEKLVSELTLQGAQSDVEKLQSLLQQWQSLKLSLFAHLDKEEQTFTLEKLAASFPPQEQQALGDKFRDHGRKHSKNPGVGLPLFLYNMADSERHHFAGLPWFLRKVLIPWVWWGQWKNHIEYYYNYPGAPI